MKIAPILTQYLYTHKYMELPGIGIFRLDPALAEEASDKKDKYVNLSAGISFENKPSITESPDLVQFISTEGGKMKALAAADLQSHLDLVHQFLNIGKPYLLEGIGSIVKKGAKEFAFTPGQPILENIRDFKRQGNDNENGGDTQSFFRQTEPKSNVKILWRKPLAALLILTGLGLAVWGGYTVYKMTTQKNAANAEQKLVEKTDSLIPPPIVIQQDTVSAKDTSVAVTTIPTTVIANENSTTSNELKYVLEIANRERAMKRYSQLNGYQWPVQMETKDSVSFTLFMKLPSTFADTTRIIDSLRRLTGNKVFYSN